MKRPTSLPPSGPRAPQGSGERADPPSISAARPSPARAPSPTPVASKRTPGEHDARVPLTADLWRRPQRSARTAEAQARLSLRRAQRKRRRYERTEARRFTERARRRRRMILASLVAFGVMVLGVVVVAYSPALSVRSIEVSGTNVVDPSAVSEALAAQLGRPLALVDYGAVDSALSRFPLIASYVTESVPPNTLRIRVVERRPVLAAQTPAGFVLLDAAGVTVQTLPERPAGYALFDAATSPIGAGPFQTAATVLRTMPPQLAAQVDSVQAPTSDSLSFLMSGSGRRVVWGSADDSALKAQILERLLAQSAVQGSEYDVSSPQSPVVR